MAQFNPLRKLNSKTSPGPIVAVETTNAYFYRIIDASSNQKICEIESPGDSMTILKQHSVLHFKGMIVKELMSNGKNVIPIQDQYLIYNNQIMQNHEAFNKYLGDVNTGNIYLQHGIDCETCKQRSICFNECKDNVKELNQTIEELRYKNSNLESDIIGLNLQNNSKADKIVSLQTESQRQQQDIIYLNALNDIKEKTEDQTVKDIIREMEVLKQKEIERQKEEKKHAFSMNQFEDYASYFGNQFPMEASILSYYEWIGLIISLVFTNDEECVSGDIIVRWIAFSLFFMIPFVIGLYKITQSNKDKQMKWYQSLYSFFNVYSFRIIILLLLMLSSDSKPFSCYIEDEKVLQLSILIIGIFCLIVHAMLVKLKAARDDDDTNESSTQKMKSPTATKEDGENSKSTEMSIIPVEDEDEEPYMMRQNCSVVPDGKKDGARYTALSLSDNKI